MVNSVVEIFFNTGSINMGLYNDSKYEVEQSLEQIHEQQLDQLGEAGTWGTGAQRIAIAARARQVGIEAGLLELPENSSIVPTENLPTIAKKIVDHLAHSPKDFGENSYQEALDGGLKEEEFVEIVGIVARIADLDVFARGIDVSLRPLPKVKAGEPSRKRPKTAKQELAWVPTVPNLPEGGDVAKDIYGVLPPVAADAYIVRGLSLVPDELKKHIELEEVQYMPLKDVRDFNYQHHKGLTRPQVEVVASKVSALNECFY
jgi:hypothetical protein